MKNILTTLVKLIKNPFIRNILVGVVVAICVHYVGKYTDFGEKFHNVAYDEHIKRDAKEYANSKQNLFEDTCLFFMDVFRADHENNNNPLITPRNMIAEMLNKARTGGAKVVIIDILLEHADCSIGGKKRDKMLLDELEKMLDEGSKTKVIFPVQINYDGKINKNIFYEVIEGKKSKKKKIFFYAVPSISATPTDNIFRYWNIYKVALYSGRPEIIWGMPFLAAILANDKEDELYQIGMMLKENIQKQETNFELYLGKRKISIPPVEVRSKRSEEKEHLPMYSPKGSEMEIHAQRIRYHLIPSGANDIKSNIESIYISYDKMGGHVNDLNGKVVIIGTSSPYIGDFHDTPIGPMPGMYIIGNAVNTILSGKQPQPIQTIQYIIIEAVIIFVFAAFSFKFHRYATLLLVGFTILLYFILKPFSFSLFRQSGVFYDFLIPIWGMYIDERISFGKSLLNEFSSVMKMLWIKVKK